MLNTTATADISFMLLTFFLVTTSMDVDRGLVRQLPSLDDEHEKHNDFVEVERENTMAFVIDSKGKLTLNGKPIDVRQVRSRVADCWWQSCGASCYKHRHRSGCRLQYLLCT